MDEGVEKTSDPERLDYYNDTTTKCSQAACNHKLSFKF